jgi:DedD protein
MAWAFWRSGKKAEPARDADAASESSGRADPTAALKVRARRQLIGAAALLLAVVIVVPMILDPTPRPVPDNILIDIPSEKTPFTPRLSLPPLPEPANAPVAPPDAQPADEGKSSPEAKEEKKPEAPKATEPAKAEAKKAEAKKAEAKKTEAKKAEPAKAGKFVVQAAALASESAANELADRIRKEGLSPRVERAEAKSGTVWRVRIGPYGVRDEAEAARAVLGTLGISADLVAL